MTGLQPDGRITVCFNEPLDAESATNLLNHVNISGFATVVNSLNYGLATGAGGMRTIQATIRFRM